MTRFRGVAAANLALQGSAAFWLTVALVGQWAFFYYIAAFYGTSTFSGNLDVWNRLEAVGRTPYVAGDTAGNLAYAAHVLGAGIIAFGGALQLMPWIRRCAPTFHRWNGRVFLLTVTALSLSGYYLVWVRRTSPSTIDELSTSINGALILSFAFLAYRSARARRFLVHRRWAMRLYLVSNAQWFLRVGFFAYFLISGLLGHEAQTADPFLSFWTFGCYLVPLGVLELYLRAKDAGGPVARWAIAAGIAVLAVLMGAGIVGFAAFSQLLVTGAPLALAD